MISASGVRASSTRMSGPPGAKQSSVSWAMGLFRGAGARLGLQPAVGDDEVGDRLDVVEVEARHRQARQLHVGGHGDDPGVVRLDQRRSEEHTSELQSLMRISYAVFCLKKKKNRHNYKLVQTNNT